MVELKPIPTLAGFVTGFALTLYIVAASTNRYVETSFDLYATSGYNELYNVHTGAFFYCFYQYPQPDGSHADQCFRIDPYCHIGAINPSNPTQPAPNLNAFNTQTYGFPAQFDDCEAFNSFRAFLMLGLVFASLALIFQLVFTSVASAGQLQTLINLGALFGILSGLFGMISMAIFAGQFKAPGWDYNYGFSLATAAWPLVLLSSLVFWFTARRKF